MQPKHDAFEPAERECGAPARREAQRDKAFVRLGLGARDRVSRHRPPELVLHEAMNLADPYSRLRTPKSLKHCRLNCPLGRSHRPWTRQVIAPDAHAQALSIERLT
jgi:hypothetical protein